MATAAVIVEEIGLEKYVESFSKSPSRYVGRQDGTTYHDENGNFSGRDSEFYFETDDNQHIVVLYSAVGDEYSQPFPSDGVVW